MLVGSGTAGFVPFVTKPVASAVWVKSQGLLPQTNRCAATVLPLLLSASTSLILFHVPVVSVTLNVIWLTASCNPPLSLRRKLNDPKPSSFPAPAEKKVGVPPPPPDTNEMLPGTSVTPPLKLAATVPPSPNR